MKEVNVSIVIPAYNSESTIKKAIESVLKQTYTNIECLVIDGSSEDGTIEILESFKKEISYISEKDNGIYHAMNKGIEMARGEWVLFLGSDDELVTDGIKNLMLGTEGADVVYGSTVLVYGSGRKTIRRSQESSIIPLHSAAVHQSVIMRKTMLKELGGFDEKYKLLADYDISLRAFLAGYKFVRTKDVISIFSMTGVSSYNFKGPIERLKIHIASRSIIAPRMYFVKDIIHLFLASVKWFLQDKLYQCNLERE